MSRFGVRVGVVKLCQDSDQDLANRDADENKIQLAHRAMMKFPKKESMKKKHIKCATEVATNNEVPTAAQLSSWQGGERKGGA
jgi:hypothetical protein